MKSAMRIVLLACAVTAWGATAGAAWQVTIPEGGVGFKFGQTVIDGLKNVSPGAAYSDETGAGFVAAEGLSAAGGQWPDALSGTYVGNLSGKPYEFQAKVANGDYAVWVCAGPIIRAEMKDRHFLLKVNDKVITDETPGDEDFAGEKYIFRFLRCQYSEKPETFWANYIDRMYPSCIQEVKVTDGKLTLAAANHFISALIAVPAARKADLTRIVADIRKQRIEDFAKTFKAPTPAKPQKKDGDGGGRARPARDDGDRRCTFRGYGEVDTRSFGPDRSRRSVRAPDSWLFQELPL